MTLFPSPPLEKMCMMHCGAACDCRPALPSETLQVSAQLFAIEMARSAVKNGEAPAVALKRSIKETRRCLDICGITEPKGSE